jgi:hypothetical protein
VAALMTMWATWTAFEPRTAARATAAPIIGPASTAVVAATVVASAVVAIAAAAAVRSLETGTRIAANARGIAREILARFGSTGARRACFSGKQDRVVFDTGWGGSRFSSGGLDGFVASVFMDFWPADRSGVQRAFVRRIRFCFAERMGVQSASLDILDLFRAYILRLCFRFAGVNLFVFLSFFSLVLGVGFFLFFFLFDFRLFKSGATHKRVRGNVSLRFFVLSFDQAGGDYRNVLFAKRSVAARGFLLNSCNFRSGG